MEDAAYGGSSTESEYYEDADYEDLEQQQSTALDVADAHAVRDHLPPVASAPGQTDSTTEAPSLLHIRTSGPVDRTAYCCSVTWEPSIVTSDPQPEPPFLFDCLHCEATVTVTEYQGLVNRHHYVCRCCRIVMAQESHFIEHVELEYERIRMCHACYSKNGPAFLAMLAVTKAPAELPCAGCHQTKPMELFPKNQRVVRPWDEMPDKSYFCQACVPKAAMVIKHTVLPKHLSCIQCKEARLRSAFNTEIDNYVYGSARMMDLENLVCNRCREETEALRSRLECSLCNQLMARNKFSKDQINIAYKEDRDPSPPDKRPIYTCKSCVNIKASKPARERKSQVEVNTLDCSHCNKTMPETDFPISQWKSMTIDEQTQNETLARHCRACLLGPLLQKKLLPLLMCMDCCTPQEKSAFTNNQRQKKKESRRCKTCVAISNSQFNPTTALKLIPGSIDPEARTPQKHDKADQEAGCENPKTSLKRKYDELHLTDGI